MLPGPQRDGGIAVSHQLSAVSPNLFLGTAPANANTQGTRLLRREACPAERKLISLPPMADGAVPGSIKLPKTAKQLSPPLQILRFIKIRFRESNKNPLQAGIF
jgi:hypothetical protein